MIGRSCIKFKEENDKFGVKDDQGNIILEDIYDSIYLGWIDKGYIIVKRNDNWGLFDLRGNQLLPIKYEWYVSLISLYKKKLKLKEDLLK